MFILVVYNSNITANKPFIVNNINFTNNKTFFFHYMNINVDVE